MILMEVAYNSRNEDFDYLAEYLIEKPGLTLTEAKELIFLIEEDKESVLKKIKAGASKKLASLKAWYQKQAASLKAKFTGTKLAQKLAELKKAYQNKLRIVKNEAESAGKKISGRAFRMKTAVKAAYRTLPKKGKVGLAIGAGAAGAAGVGAGLAAYRAKKKRQEAVAAKKK